VYFIDTVWPAVTSLPWNLRVLLLILLSSRVVHGSRNGGFVLGGLGALEFRDSEFKRHIFRFQEDPAVNDSKPLQLAIGQMLEFAAARIWQRPMDPRWIHTGHSPKMWSFADLKSYPKWLQVSLDFRWWSCIRVTGTTSGCLGLPRCCSRKLPFT